jgi:hypothetical protein
VARIGAIRDPYKVWWGNLREGNHLEDRGVGGRIILKWTLRSRMGGEGGMDRIDVAQDKDR